MITIEKTISLEISYPISRLGDPESLAFFDIETTGFSASFHSVYLIGVLFPSRDGFRFLQWFADTPDAEPEVLASFFSFLENSSVLVHFNGDTFDIPFLKKRAERFGLPAPFERVKSVDIYKRAKPWKKILGLKDLKQKSIEGFLHISREDQYSGGQLIEIYQEYLKTREQSLLSLLLLHNEDDLKGMPALLPVLSYPDFFSQEFSLCKICPPAKDKPVFQLVLEGRPELSLPVPLTAVSPDCPDYEIFAEKNRLTLSIRPYEGVFRHFFPNCKDYYYLIYEDTAVHKSVGEYVDRQARKKATRETCYTKKEGSFLPQPSPLITPEFKRSWKEKDFFFEMTPGCLADPEKRNAYIKEILRAVLSVPGGLPSP